MLIFGIYSSKKAVSRMLYSISATANGMMKKRESSSMVVFRVRVTKCKMGFSV